MNLIGWHNIEKSSKPLEDNMQVLVGQALQSKTQLFQKENKFLYSNSIFKKAFTSLLSG